MKSEDKKWQIWVDTGGTFTDCIGISPAGIWHRTKVLSNGVLRAVIIPKNRSNQFSIKHNWPLAASIFEGYQLHFPGYPDFGVFKINQLDPIAGSITLDRFIQIDHATTIEVSAKEEAPILGARILTQTPLHKNLPLCQFRLGTTKGTNALLERKEAKTLLLITKGFKNLLEIGDQSRPDLFQLNIPPRTQFHSNVMEVNERISASGEDIIPLTISEISRIISYCKVQQPAGIAIAFTHSYAYPENELLLAKHLSVAGFPFVCASHEVVPTIGFLHRSQTCIINTVLLPILHQYLESIQSKLGQSSLQLMTSAGGLWPKDSYKPVESLLSGPAGGVVGAKAIAELLGFDRMLSFDMGGTSTDTAHYYKAFDYHYESKTSDWELLTPALGIETVAAGGGSICYLKNGRLQVGPHSAGANPGPACYGAGGPLTITDVNLLLGKMTPESFSIPIQKEEAITALDQLIQDLESAGAGQYSRQEVLEGFIQIANEKMAEAIRKISVSAGYDPSHYPLIAFGGAGGLHACKLAEQLGISTVILPKDGGLLSAYGIGQAQIERWENRQILQLFSDFENQIPSTFEQLLELAKKAAQKAEPGCETIILKQSLFLRFRGQNNTIETPWSPGINPIFTFKKEYETQFGQLAQLPIELESIRVLVASKNRTIPAPPHNSEPIIENLVSSIPIYFWNQLAVHSTRSGPLILAHDFSTTFVEKGWELSVYPSGDIVLKKKASIALDHIQGEAIKLELFTNRFTAIAKEMGAMLQRTAFSVNIRERLDFSCGMLDANGFLLVNAPHIPVHLGSLGVCARLSLAACPLGPDDILIVNHPKYGGSHLPDVTLLAPVHDKQIRLIGYLINRAHHAEIGGKTPGSMPPDARSLEEEGVVILPTKITKDGKIDWDLLNSIFQDATYPTRSLPENMSDIRAGINALKVGKKKLIALVDSYGLSEVQKYMNAIRQQAKKALEKVLGKIGNQSWQALEKLDDGHEIKLQIKIKAKKISFDFSGTSSVHPGNLNANLSIVNSAILYVLRVICADQIPLNEGLLEPVDIHLPKCFLNPDFSDHPSDCPAVVGGNTEVSQRLVDTLLFAFNIVSCGHGSMNNFLFGKINFGYYETIGGGSGAGPGFSGRHAVHQHMTNTRITDVEVLENRYPVHLHEFSIRKNSGGKGKWNGGDGIIREIEFLTPVTWTLISQHRKEKPYGKKGGEPGKTGNQFLIKKSGEKIALEGMTHLELQAGDRIRIETPGGGGWGIKVEEDA